MTRMLRPQTLTAGLLAATYAGLLMLAAICSMGQLPASAHDHHGSHAPHSLLCAWACQAASDEQGGDVETVAVFRPLILLTLLPPPSPLPSIDPTGCPSRAPPLSA